MKGLVIKGSCLLFSLASIAIPIGCGNDSSGNGFIQSSKSIDSAAASLPGGVTEVANTWSGPTLEAFTTKVGDMQVVALGESFHRSPVLLSAKANLTKLLIEQHGYRAIGFESGWADAQGLADFLLTCSGDAEAAVKAAIPLFESDATADLINWICAFNADHPSDQISVFGFDVNQYHPWQNFAAIDAYLAANQASLRLGLVDGLSLCRGKTSVAETTGVYSEVDFHLCLAAIAKIRATIKAGDLSVALGSFATVQQLAFYQQTPEDQLANVAMTEARDLQMARNILSLRKATGTGAKTVIWAHNFHVKVNSGPQKTMGLHLANSLYDPQKDITAYMPVAIIGDALQVDPGDWIQPRAVPDAADSLETILGHLWRDRLYVDLESTSLFAEHRPYRFEARTQMYPDGSRVDFETAVVPALEFRGLVFVRMP